MAWRDRIRRWQGGILILSLGLNLLILGVVGGALLRGAGLGPPPRMDLSMGALMRAFDESDRAALRDLARNRAPDRGGDRDRRSPRPEEAARLAQAIGAVPFDPDEMRAALDSVSDRLKAYQAEAQEVLIAYVAGMGPEERAALAERVLGELRHRGPDRDTRN